MQLGHGVAWGYSARRMVCRAYDASVFETTIRVVGGLLSAFHLSGDKVFLTK